MIDVILFVQSGDDGPVRLVGCTGRSINRTLAALQKGNPAILHIRKAIAGDERTEHRLHTEIDPHYLAREWYDPIALGVIPPTFLPFQYSERAERQRVLHLRVKEAMKRP